MVKGSSLYIVIIIALVIGILCSSLIVVAYFYKIQYQKKFRYDQLDNNLSSGINILLGSTDTSYTSNKSLSLFNNNADSILISRMFWGLYDVGIVKSFTQNDTLYKAFTFANSIDSAKWAAVYLVDKDRPFSLSGKTTIRGDSYIPKAGVQQAYIDNKAYQGDKRLIIGTKHNSEKALPDLGASRLALLDKFFKQNPAGDSSLSKNDTVRESFLNPSRFVNFKKKTYTLKNIFVEGNIILFSDTTLTIDSSAVFKNIMVFARAIIVNDGFHCNCQLFATDSIRIGKNCRFDYPSSVGVLRFNSLAVKTNEKITLGQNTNFSGVIFTYEKTENQVKPLIEIGKNVKIKGQVYSQGMLALLDSTEVDGSVFTDLFFYRDSFTLLENYLINTTIDSKALSAYYLTSDLLPVAGKKKKILQWLQSN